MEEPKIGEVDDLTVLAKLDEKILLNELRVRYENDRIYTYVGDILVAINPFKKLNLYDKQYCTKYKLSKKGSLPPHIFAVADATYQNMLGYGGSLPRNQCILISGESGAGKTESTKLLIKQLIELCKGNTQLEQQILQVNPLLEAFGNAQTLMNDNSSRFGKYIQLKFKNGTVTGAKISEYLLEKSRVVQQNKGEENFHIFYYMFAGLSPEQKTNFGLDSNNVHRYVTTAQSSVKAKLASYQQDYEELVNAMDMVGFLEEEQENMFRILCGVLNTGDITFQQQDEDIINTNNKALSLTAECLGLDASEVLDTLTCSVAVTRGEVVKRNYTKSQAEDARDALAKAIYGRLFSWIINKVNSLLAPKDLSGQTETNEIGILDIFGFEHFEKNSFEQACINLANEQLQFFFNKHIFMLEQEEYKKEGVDWKEITFVDNQPLLDLFLGRPIGLLALLDEESQFPQGSGHSLVQKFNKNLAGNRYFLTAKNSHSNNFTISHYAGKVVYDSSGWLEKNRDTMPPGLMEMLQRSENSLLSVIFKGKLTRTGTLALQGRSRKSMKSRRSTGRTRPDAARLNKATKERKLTVGAQFKNSLQVLMERMTTSNPVFVRCIKPNNQKAPSCFDGPYVTAQLLYTGMLETINIRREGFAVRPTFQEFVDKYKILLVDSKAAGDRANCERILKKTGLQGWHVGKTKVFLKYHHLDALADQLQSVAQAVLHLQRGVRGFLARCRVKAKKQEALKQAEQLAKLLEQVSVASKTYHSTQQTMISTDKTIPNDYFLEKPSPPSIKSMPPAPVTMTPVSEATYELEQASNGDDGVSSGSDSDVLEDDFTPIQSSGMTKFGRIGTKSASIKWFQQTQSMKLQKSSGGFFEWFHGIITRRESERLLENKSLGCFLIRVSESRFGYSLSFRAEDRCRHYMIDQTPSGKYIIIGEAKVHKSLADLVQHHQQVPISNWKGTLKEPCGQTTGQCDYDELLSESAYFELERGDSVASGAVGGRRSTGGYEQLQRDEDASYELVPPPLPQRNYDYVTEIGSKPISKRGPLPKPPTDAYLSLIQNQEDQSTYTLEGHRK
ncbi:unnamed protein product [Owenia fusiformis]|uniref:Uncharacterized protein n=1 Tax=Owenia fusiformis TaxID=6347 RepID=A0A8J1XUT3_OWEFU|nr:unnamed protein product [Owenia fusiformis]